MEIFYIKKDEFLQSVDKTCFDRFSDGREFLSEDKYLEHVCGIFLVKFIAKHIYDVKNTDIELRGKKPFFVNDEIFFSISHSRNIVLAAFNNANIGVDVEYMYPRNYKRIMDRYGRNFVNPTKKDFYRFWTIHEAEIKLGADVRSLFSAYFLDDYALSCVSADVLVSDFNIKELIADGTDIDLVREFRTPKFLRLASCII